MSGSAADEALTEIEWKRRVLLLCVHCARNLAYYRAGREVGPLLKDSAFWRNIYNNFLDLCILEWCKLFGDAKGVHFWLTVLGEESEEGFLHELGTTKGEHEAYVEAARRYRDKFVAHLDSDRTMNVPELDRALETAALLYDKVRRTVDRSVIADFPLDFMTAYNQSFSEARTEYCHRMERDR